MGRPYDVTKLTKKDAKPGHVYYETIEEWRAVKAHYGEVSVNIEHVFTSGHCYISLTMPSVSNKMSSSFYSFSEWKKIVGYTDPKKESTVRVFNKDQYIVILKKASYSFSANFVYKQRVDSPYLRPYKDDNGNKVNGLMSIGVDGCKWRHATKQEAEEYERVGKPFNTIKPNSPPCLPPYISSLFDREIIAYSGLPTKNEGYLSGIDPCGFITTHDQCHKPIDHQSPIIIKSKRKKTKLIVL